MYKRNKRTRIIAMVIAVVLCLAMVVTLAASFI